MANPIANYFNQPMYSYQAGPGQPMPSSLTTDPNQYVQNSLANMLNPNSQYIQNARQQGAEYAASRGGLNSSIAAGASERSAIEAAQPLMQSALQMKQQQDQIAGQNWLDTQNFNRNFQGTLAMLPIQNSYQMLNAIQQAALQDPSMWGPEVISGYSNFFTNNMNDIMSRFFGASQAPIVNNDVGSAPASTGQPAPSTGTGG